MSNETDDAAVAPTSKPGPDLLAERTLTGIFVHLLGLLTGFVAPAVVYLVSDSEFTRANARNALDWQLFYFALTAASLLLFGVAFVADAVLPDAVTFVFLLVAVAAFFLVGIVGLLDFAFAFVATGKAIFGTAWEYPVAPDFSTLDRTGLRVAFGWWKLLVAYVLTAPVALGTVAWLATTDGPASAWAVGFFIVTLIVTMMLSVITLAVLYRDARTLRTEEAAWQPNWVPYVAFPFVIGVATLAVSALALQSANPPGNAVYGYLFALWLSSLAYLYRRRGRTAA